MARGGHWPQGRIGWGVPVGSARGGWVGGLVWGLSPNPPPSTPHPQQPYVPPAQPLPPPSPSPAGGAPDQLSKTNLYIRGLHPGTTDQDLVKLCQP